MKKRRKIKPRTKIYLTIVGLLALTGVFYAANPSQRATVPKSVASPDVPTAHPTPFAMLEGPNGVAAIPGAVYATQQCSQNLSLIDCNGIATTVATIPGSGCPVERYMAVAPIQSAAAGFTPRDIFITQGADIFKFSGGIVTPFATVGCPGSDHTSLTFDHEGTFGNKMIVTCEHGPVFTVNGAGISQLITVVVGAMSVEGPAVAPSLGFGPLGGQLLVADDVLGQIHAIKHNPDDTYTVTLNVFQWPGAESVNVIPSEPCLACPGGVYFQAAFDVNTIYTFPLTDFIGLGGGILVNSEAPNFHGTALITFNSISQTYDTTLFDNTILGRQEGASFVDCDIPSPTPTATPTATATATFTPTPTNTPPPPPPTPTAPPTTCGTAFVIGDLDAVVGNHVTFWGAQWWKKNHLSGGGVQARTPASFKGFANCTNPNPPTCGGTWQSDPGNSSHPPDTVPADITVIVSSSITKSGPVESGDIVKMVTIHTDPGYGPNPGHEGTGTVTAVICGAGPQQPRRPAGPAPRPR